jgi:hypothetical protein
LAADAGAAGLGANSVGEGESLREGMAHGEDVMDAAEDDDGARRPTKRYGLAGELVV